MKKVISFVGLSLLIVLSAILPARAKLKRKNPDYRNPHNIKWTTRGAYLITYLVIKVYHNKQYKKDKDMRIGISKKGDSLLSRMFNLHQIKKRPIVVIFPDSFYPSRTLTRKGFYCIGLSLNNNFIEGIGNCFIYCNSSKYKPPPHEHSDKGEPLLRYKKAEFYDFSDMPVNKIKENPDWKVKVKLKYEIALCFHEYKPDGRKRYKGRGLVKMVVVGPHGKKCISKVKKISKYQCYNFKFPDDFITPGLKSKPKIENGYHRYYFTVDGVKIKNRQNGFIIIHHSDNKTIPTCNIIHLYDCRKLYREFVDKRRVVEKELNMK